jgi:hypothetical protein
MTRDEQLDRLANNCVLLVAELRNNSKQQERVVESLHSATEAMLATKRVAAEALDNYETLAHQGRLAITESNKLLAVISKDVDDVERVTREATGAHRLAAADDTKAGLVRTFGALPRFTQVLIAILFALLAASGWLHMIFK